jgi:hypothetical protein
MRNLFSVTIETLAFSWTITVLFEYVHIISVGICEVLVHTNSAGSPSTTAKTGGSTVNKSSRSENYARICLNK